MYSLKFRNMASTGVYSFDNEIFRLFATYAGLVILKMMAVALLTSKYRVQNNVFANSEDLALAGDDGDKLKPIRNDEALERIRRCHLNDLENVLPFVLLGLLYVATEPTFNVASLLFRTFAFSRFFHTAAYLAPLPQPSRALAFFIGVIVNIAMAVVIVYHGQM